MIQGESNDEKIWPLLSAQLANEADKQQVDALHEWIEANPWFKPVMKCCTALWATNNKPPIHTVEAQLALERHWKKIEQLQIKTGLEQDGQKIES